jgi:hypothetical protein
MWNKLGLLIKASNQYEFMYSHTAMPQALHLKNDLFRIYYGTRNKQNEPSIGFLEIDINCPNEVLYISDSPVLIKGQWGMFDDNGLYPGNIITVGKNKLYMYYMGRSNGQGPLYYMSIGVSESNDNGKTFTKKFKAPILGRSEFDPWMTTTPFVIREDKCWRMWYTSGFAWNMRKDNPKSYYHIKYAYSSDGINWNPTGKVCIELEKGESNIASPSVLWEDCKYKMWYCYVQDFDNYKIGYAESINGIEWERKDSEVGIELSDHSFDNTCMAYPCVFKHKDRKYMIYSGNVLGKEGLGLAVYE